MAGARYSYGGDEFILVELSDEMSLESNFQAVAITNDSNPWKDQMPGSDRVSTSYGYLEGDEKTFLDEQF